MPIPRAWLAGAEVIALREEVLAELRGRDEAVTAEAVERAMRERAVRMLLGPMRLHKYRLHKYT